MSSAGTRAVASIIVGEPRHEDRRVESRGPRTWSGWCATPWPANADACVDACRAMRAAQPEWAAVPAPARGRAIAQIGRLVVEGNKESPARLVTRETGKPYTKAPGEVQDIVDTCDFFLSEAGAATG